MNQEQVPYRLGKWIGRGQAFALTANHSLLAQARCWKEIHDSADYKSTGLSWDDFCMAEIGLSRPCVDTMIASLEEFGETYCRLSEIVRISPATYRAISPKIDDGAIEIDGEMVPIVVENAARIRGALNQMRNQLRQAGNPRPTKDPLASAQKRLQGSVTAVSRIIEGTLEAAQKDALRGVIENSLLRLMEISERLAA